MPSVGSSLTIGTAAASTYQFCSRFEVGVDRLLQRPTSCVGCVSAVHQISSAGIFHLEERIEILPMAETTEEEVTGVTVEKVAVAEVHLGNGRSGWTRYPKNHS